MTEQRNILHEMVDRLFGELMSGGMPDQRDKLSIMKLWKSVEEVEITNLFKSEADGGFGGCWQDACVVFNSLGYHALPLPVGESILAKKLLLDAGLECLTDILSLGICKDAKIKKRAGSKMPYFSGSVMHIPRDVEATSTVVACAQDECEYIVLLSNGSETSNPVRSTTSRNEADETRTDFYFENATPIAMCVMNNAVEHVYAMGALLRAGQMSGALLRILQRSVLHAQERIQFGRPLSKFQAIQHQLALLAEEVAAVNCAVQSACISADGSAGLDGAMFEIAATKLRANRAVAQSTSIAHQTHGAIGVTKEHSLHYSTQRLWAWSSEYGNERYWANFLGRKVLDEGAENFWANLTKRSDLRL